MAEQPTQGAAASELNGVRFKMVYVQGGTFTMGATPEQGSDAYDNEKPVHQVTLSDYYIGKYEVTQGQWQAVMGSNPSRFKKGENYPVENVSWEDAREFCGKLSRLTGKTFVLPTEAQWEYAARGGNKSKGYKYSGSNSIGSVAWYDDNSGTTHPVGTKSPNELGLYDMSGNVWEWCADCYGDYSAGSQTHPQGPSSGSCRVLRGGGWDDFAGLCRVSGRLNSAPDLRGGNLGFRVALIISATGVSLNKTSLTLAEGSSETLIATVSPDNATDKNVTWSSDNTGVATVDNTGKVTAVSPGTATITVTTEDGNKTAVCNVTVKAKIPDPSLVLDKNAVNFAAAGGEQHGQAVIVTSNRDWTAETTASWLTIAPVSGKAAKTGVTVKLTAEANDSETDRTATVTFKAEGIEKVLTVTQAGKIPDPSLVLDRNKVDFAAAGGAESVTLTSNRDWTAKTSANWLTIVPAAGEAAKTGVTVRLTAEANGSESERTVTVTFKADGVEQILTVTQAGKIPDPSLVLDRSKVDFAAAGGDQHVQTVTVTSNRDWTAKTTAGWLTIVPASGKAAKTGTTVKLTAKANDSESERTATVTFKAEGVEKVLTVTQVGKIPDPSLVLDRSKLDFAAAGGAESLTVTSNRDWTAETTASWLTIAPVSGKAAKTGVTIKLTAEANDSEAARTATVIFKAEGVEKSLTVTQAGKSPDPSLVLDKNKVSLTAAGGEQHVQTVTVTSNRDWAAETSASWLTIAPASGKASETGVTVKLTAEANDSETDRTATVTFKAEGVELSLTVTQAGKIPDPLLSIDKSDFAFKSSGGEFTVNVTHNVDYEIRSDVNWITQSLTRASVTDELHFSVEANPSMEDRTGRLTFISKDGTLRREVTVTQHGVETLTVSPKSFNFDWEAHTFQVTVNANVDYELHSNVSWLKKSLTQSGGAGTLHFSVEANPTTDARTGRLTFLSKDGTLKQEVTVQQKEASVLVETAFGMQLRLVRVKGGTFDMGAQSTDANGKNYDAEAFNHEGPVHRVTLSDYYIGEIEVTQGQWQAVMGTNPSYFKKGDNYPVETVSWNEIQDFIQKLNEQTGKRYVLPTEAQWEYAARGGNRAAGTKYSGSASVDEVAWYAINSGGSTTHPVGTKSPNELGIYDMSGNVWEWCADWYDWYGDYSSSSQTNPQGPSSGSDRMSRGGSWLDIAGYCRVSFRFSYSPDSRSNYLGFRLVLLP